MPTEILQSPTVHEQTNDDKLINYESAKVIYLPSPPADWLLPDPGGALNTFHFVYIPHQLPEPISSGRVGSFGGK